MSNLLHHILAAAWSFALAAALLTLAAKVWLSHRLQRLEHPAQFDSVCVYFALVVPGLLPLVWLLSGLAHLADSGALTDTCCSILMLSEANWQQWVFGAGALVLAGLQVRSLWRRWRPEHRAHAPTTRGEVARRVRDLCEAHAQLNQIVDRVRVVDCEAHVCATVGLFDQRIEIAASLAERLDDSALEAALLHEAAHLAFRDSARSFLLLVAQVVNPLGRVLCREASAWRFAREIVCDDRAVEHGAARPSMAEAIVTAARASSGDPGGMCARLTGPSTDALIARINLLLSDSAPVPGCQRGARVPAIGSTLLAAALIVPHALGAQLISIHCLFEETLSTLTFLM